MSEVCPNAVEQRYRTRLSQQLCGYTPGDKHDLLEFRRSLWGAAAERCAPGYFRWQFERCPAARVETPQIWVYRRDGEVIGQQAGIAVRLKVGSGEHGASWAIDLAVKRAYRLRGIGAILSEAHAAANDIALGLGISDAAYRAYVRAGWTDLGRVPLYVLPLDLGRMLSIRWRRHAGRIIGSVGNGLLRIVGGVSLARNVLRRVRMVEIGRFDRRADELWRAACAYYPVICRRDSRTLNWRFVACPRADRYRRFYFLAGDRVVGYAVLKMSRWHGVPAGDVVDYLCTPRWTAALFASCARFLRRHGAAAVYCLHTSPRAASILRSLGFFRRESGTRLMVHANVVPHQAVELLKDRGNWFITAGDSDADPPGRDDDRGG